MTHTVYFLFSPSHGRSYIGFTRDLKHRLGEHLSGEPKSISYTDDWKIVWNKEVSDSQEARSLEKRIKKRGAKRFLQDQET